MKPSLGRIVHYVGADGTHHAAIITRVWSGDTCVNLTVFHSGACLPEAATSVVLNEPSVPFSWHWPEKE
jgi:hypothetical protein